MHQDTLLEAGSDVGVKPEDQRQKTMKRRNDREVVSEVFTLSFSSAFEMLTRTIVLRC